MLRRHFMNSADAPNIIITYHAPNHVKFGLGNFTKGSVDNANIGNISVISDSWNNGIGQWGLKADYPEILGSNFTQIIDSETTVSAMANSYTKFRNGNIVSGELYFYITKLIIPEGITDLWNTFINIDCSDIKLEEIILPNTLKRMYGTFIGNQPNNITSYTIPASVEYVEKLSDAFIVESSLKEIIMEPLNPPTSRYENPFGDIAVSNIPDVKIKVCADSINNYKNDDIWGMYKEFYDIANNIIVYYDVDDNRCLYKETNDITVIPDLKEIRFATQLYLPNTITNLKLDGYIYLKEFVIPDGVTQLDLDCISNCFELEKLTINDNITKINSNTGCVFNCKKLTTIIFNNNNITLTEILLNNRHTVKYVILGEDINIIQPFCFMGFNIENIIFTNNITSIGYSAFYDCQSINNIIIPNNINEIGDGAFYSCTSLSNIDLSDSSVCEISMSCFYNCTSLNNIILNNSIQKINNLAFANCSSLESISLPADLHYIGPYAFKGCSNLTNITFNNVKAAWNLISFGDDWKSGVPATVVHCTDGDINI